MADIGFHEFEIGTPQRLAVTVEIWLDHIPPADNDDPALAWDYDYLREQIEELASARRYNLQESLAHALYDRFAAMRGVRALQSLLPSLMFIPMHGPWVLSYRPSPDLRRRRNDRRPRVEQNALHGLCAEVKEARLSPMLR